METKLKSYDGRDYTLEIIETLPKGSGFYVGYSCVFHDDISVRGKTLKEAKEKLRLRVNAMRAIKLLK